jgi:proteasome lid subunit RPN8/RPN11
VVSSTESDGTVEKTLEQVEVFHLLTGKKEGLIALATLSDFRVGAPCRVQFDPAWVLAQEKNHGDVLGFYHTHPNMVGFPSERDDRTMMAWVNAFNRPLYCVIEGSDGVHTYIYYPRPFEKGSPPYHSTAATSMFEPSEPFQMFKALVICEHPEGAASRYSCKHE